MTTANGTGALLVVDDDTGVRALVISTLRSCGLQTAEAASGEEALALAEGERPAGVVLDVAMPGLSGYEVCRALRERYGPSLPILFVSGARTESYDRVAGLLVGADDYLVKPFAPDELAARVRVLLRRGALAGAAPALTRREREVLTLLAQGLRHGEIARRLVISPKTVGTHVGNVLSKLGVETSAQAVARAFRDGLVDGPV